MEIIVLGPVNGLYYLAYESTKPIRIYTLGEFVDPSKAAAIAIKMMADRRRAQKSGN